MKIQHINLRQRKFILIAIWAIFVIVLSALVVPVITSNANAEENKANNGKATKITNINLGVDKSKFVTPYTGDYYNYLEWLQDSAIIGDQDFAITISTDPTVQLSDLWAAHSKKHIMLKEDERGVDEEATQYVEGRGYGVFIGFEIKESCPFIFDENVTVTSPEGRGIVLRHLDDRSLDLFVELGKVSAKGHIHTMTKFPAADATQTTAGHKTYYQCSECKKYFEDEAGATEITNLTDWLNGPGKTDDSWEVQFTNHKNAKIAILKAIKKDGDSQAVTETIDKAIADIEAMEYNSEISLDENKAKVDKVVSDTESAVEKQREAEKNIKEASDSAQTGDNIAIVVLALLVLATGVYVAKRKLFD